MKCENCGSEMKLQEGIVYTSNPVRYGYKCPNCGNVQYSMIKEENNQKDYEKKYKDALANARQEYTTTENIERKQWLEELFPELAKSEDEQLIEEIIYIVKQYRESLITEGRHRFDDCIAWLEKQGKPQDKGEISDGYHTFNELYYYRMLYNAAFFNMLPKEWVHKSKRHNDGEECFGGGWFIVMANLPTGQISNHYELKDWDLFQIPEKEVADKWDGHTPQEAADRLHKYLLEKQSEQKPFDHEHATITQKDFAPKQEWSEDDETMRENIEGALDCYESMVSEDWEREKEWLKSLKERITWKPSKEQIHAFEQVYEWYNDNFAPSETLTSLYNDLKKL